jgi:hypothetical protein
MVKRVVAPALTSGGILSAIGWSVHGDHPMWAIGLWVAALVVALAVTVEGIWERHRDAQGPQAPSHQPSPVGIEFIDSEGSAEDNDIRGFQTGIRAERSKVLSRGNRIRRWLGRSQR